MLFHAAPNKTMTATEDRRGQARASNASGRSKNKASTNTMASEKNDETESLDINWAKSLVGREWEIYWDEEGDDSNEEEDSDDKEDDKDKQKEDAQNETADTPMETKTPQMWGCNVCRRPFSSYTEAAHHEELCRRQQHEQIMGEAARGLFSQQAGAPFSLQPQIGAPVSTILQQQQMGGVPGAPFVYPVPTMYPGYSGMVAPTPQVHPQYYQQQLMGTGPGAASVNSAGYVNYPIPKDGHAGGTTEEKQAAKTSKPQQQEKDKDGDSEMKNSQDESESEEDERVADVTDWYDATVVGFDSETENFQIRFVGDDTIYTMKLKPSIVRPCVQAWTKRSKAILKGLYSGEAPFDFNVWEKQLPLDTATLEDHKYLDHEWKGALEVLSHQDSSTPDLLSKDRANIVRLCFLVQSQVYLRAKLAPVVPSGADESGIPGMSDAYLDRLEHMLKELQGLCVWYEDCFSLRDQVFSNSAAAAGYGRPDSQQSGDIPPLYPPGGSLFNIEYLRGHCLEKGRATISGFLAKDFSRVGGKRKPAAVSQVPSARATKRRKGYRATGFLVSQEENQNDGIFFLEEGGFMSLKSVRKFASKLTTETSKWYVAPLLRMLERLCLEVQEPVRVWKRRVNVILGDNDESDDDDSSKSEDLQNDDMRSDEAEKSTPDAEKSDEEQESYFSFDDISSCLEKVRNDRVLSKFDLSQWTNLLRAKLSGIESFEADVWRTIPQIVDEVGQTTKGTDTVLSKLRAIKEAAESTNEHIKNVDPIGRKSSRLTRTVIDNAIAVRKWILDLHHADQVRERLSFVQNVVSRAPTLPHVPTPPHRLVDESTAAAMSSRLGRAMSRIQSLSSKLYSHVHVFSRYENIVAENDSVQLRSKQEVRAALDELRATPVISIVEEKLSVRLDIHNWRDSVQGPLEDMRRNCLKYDVLESLKEELDTILNGSSASRSEILDRLEMNATVDSDIRQFANSEIEQFCGEEARQINTLYLTGKSWADRADSIILALRVHGNPTAGSSLIGTNKTAAMVDLKRVDDLLSEYNELGSTMEERRTRLSSIREEGMSWCSNVKNIITEDSNVLERLIVARDTRPRGVLMDPARHVVDAWIEVLEWQNRVQDAIRNIVSSTRSIPGGVASAAFSTIISDTIYPLLLEGQEVVSMFSQQNASEGTSSFVPDDAFQALIKLQGNQKPIKKISTTKLESSELGQLILSRIVDRGVDSTHGSPLFCLLFFAWRVAVIALTQRLTLKSTDTAEQTQSKPTLEEARQLDAAQPLFSDDSAASQDETSSLLLKGETQEVVEFRKLISDGDRVEATTRALLPTTKDVVRGSFEKKSEVREHLTKLKELQAEFKSRLQDKEGFVLSSSLEQSLDSVVKDVTWLTRTFPYAALQSDTLPTAEEDGDMSDSSKPSDGAQSVAIPWDLLVSLHERLPDPITGPGGDISRVSLRVKELFEVASQWQDEVTNQMSLSFRGGARRRSAEEDEVPKINMERLAQLAQHPILARVAMPREEAVRKVLDRAHDFEESLAGLLNTDFEGIQADKTPYPESDSLVGKNGDFLLYRLTGSTLFEELKATLRKMSKIAADVLADTPGKVAFDWIVKAVAWIQDLQEAVDDTSSTKGRGSGKLAILSSNAEQLLERGNNLFLEFTDDVRRTLAAHKISLSTNKQTERLTVVIGKGGALHSLGGTAIKWCPLLLEWLKADVERLEEWEREVIGLSIAFESMATNSKPHDRESIYKFLQLQEKAASLLDNGRESLVISPQKTLVNGLVNLKARIDEWTDRTLSTSQQLLGIDGKALKRTRFEDGGPAVDDRYALLEALLNRRALEEEVATRKGAKTPRKPTNVPAGSTARDKARSMLERALLRGMHGMMGIDDSEASLFCSLKAAEIEETLFAAHRKEFGSRLVTDQYRDKLRSMRYNLEDIKNPTLCPRVLVGEISVAQLVMMSSEEMASQKVKLKKQKAEEEAKKAIIVNPAAAKPKEAATPKEDQPARTIKSLLESSLKSSPMNPKSVLKKSVASLPPPSLMPSDDSLIFDAPSPKQGKPIRSLLSQKMPPAPLDTKPSWQEAAAFLPTPPSLALTTPPSLAIASTPVASSSRFVKNTNGKETFAVSVSDATRIFEVKLELVDESHRSSVQNVLPELLTEKGRSPIETISDFLSQKLKTGRWTGIPMRLSTTSETAAAEYKKYYKDYEQRKRISVFHVGKESRLFLFTPKFHGAAKPLKFSNKTSTYAVLLMRSR